jgi:hypothetical protein
MRDSAVETLFSLFTSSDRALAIAGDLAEESDQRGRVWFWLQVMAVTCALWRIAAMQAPARVIALLLGGLALLCVPVFAGFAAVLSVPNVMSSPAAWFVLPFFWWGGALWIGASLVILGPRSGMSACVVLAVAVEAVLVWFGAPVLWRDPSNGDFVLYFTNGVVSGLPLVAGAAIARRRWLVLSTNMAQR